MAKEVLELEVKTNVSGAKQEMDELGSSVNNAETELKELNEQLEIQVEVVNKLETALLEMKQQQSVNSDYENSVSRLNERIKETTMELALEKQGLKTLKRERSLTIKNVKDLEKAQKDQIKQAFAGIKHFNIMGVSLRRLRLMVRAVIPGFKLMFKTIKTGIASTGIGLIVIALASIGTAMARTGKGAKAFKAVLAGLKEVVDFLLKPLELAGDFILTLFGVGDDAPALTSAELLANEMERIDGLMGEINLKRAKDNVQLDANKRIIDDVTKSEEERLAAAENSFNTNLANNEAELAALQETLKAQEAHLKQKEADLRHEKRREQEHGRSEQRIKEQNAVNKALKDRQATLEKIANLQGQIVIDERNYGDEVKNIESFNINQAKEREKELANQRKQFREQRANGEKKIAAIILKLQQEAAIEELATDEEKEKKKLEFKMQKQKEDILNSKASQKSKDAALLLLEEDFQNDLQEITDKFDDKNQKKLDKEAEDLKKIRNQNLLAEEEDETKRQLMLLDIQKQAELDKLAEHENFAELKLAIDEKYAGKVRKIEKKSAADQKKLDADVAKAKSNLANQGLQIIQEVAGEGSKIAKGAAIAQATISGVEAVQNAFTTAQKSPITAVFPAYPFLQAGAAATFSALQLRKIISGEPASDDGGGGLNGMQEVADTTPATQMLSGSFTLGQGQAPEPVKAFVVTDEMTNSQNQLANIRRRSTI